MDILLSLECCDCGRSCEIKFCLLTSGNRIVYLTTCAYCNDHKTMRLYKVLPSARWLEAAALGLPVVKYKEVA